MYVAAFRFVPEQTTIMEMKPYKIIKSGGCKKKPIQYVMPLPRHKMPLWFIKNVHTPPKAEIVAKGLAADHQTDSSGASHH
jgi:hypothetical protein